MQITKRTRVTDHLLLRLANKLCSLFGHRWLYKDYSNYIQADGCNQHAYFYSEWITQSKSEIDYEGDYNARHTIEINKVIYS